MLGKGHAGESLDDASKEVTAPAGVAVIRSCIGISSGPSNSPQSTDNQGRKVHVTGRAAPTTLTRLAPPHTPGSHEDASKEQTLQPAAARPALAGPDRARSPDRSRTSPQPPEPAATCSGHLRHPPPPLCRCAAGEDRSGAAAEIPRNAASMEPHRRRAQRALPGDASGGGEEGGGRRERACAWWRPAPRCGSAQPHGSESTGARATRRWLID